MPRYDRGGLTMIDPTAAITTISLGLKVIDQFRELVLNLRGKPVTPPGGTVERAGDTLRVSHGGTVDQEVRQDQLNLDFWDDARYQALQRRTRLNWSLLQEYFAESAALSAPEKALMNVRMKTTEEELCQDFREMVRIFERAMGMGLPDHYQLYEVCTAE
jgi:hypothetical protein